MMKMTGNDGDNADDDDDNWLIDNRMITMMKMMVMMVIMVIMLMIIDWLIIGW